MQDKITFTIKENVGVISKGDGGWKKELNIVSWNGSPPKYDIRDWDAEHEHMGRGITLYENEMAVLTDLYVKCGKGNLVGNKVKQKS